MNKKTLKDGFGKCFRAAREARKQSRAALSLRLGISPKTIQSWEMGRTFPEDLALIPAIEQELGISFASLISDSMKHISAIMAEQREESSPSVNADLSPLAVELTMAGERTGGIDASGYAAVPLLKSSSAGKPLSELQDDDVVRYVLFPAEWIVRGRLLVAFRMKDTTMEPFVQHGAVVLCDTRQTTPAKLYGQIVALWHHELGLRIRRMAVGNDGTLMGLSGRDSGKGLITLDPSTGDRVIGVIIGLTAEMQSRD